MKKTDGHLSLPHGSIKKMAKMKCAAAIMLALMLVPWAASAGEDIEANRKSVVRIFTVSQTPDYTAPWDPGKSNSGMGTGFIISKARILTNAHVVSNARFITVEKEGDSRRYEGHVKFIAHDCDLAMLEVSDKSFFKNTAELPLGNVPNLDSIVTVLGYPIGGDRLSVTRGVVSRIDYQVFSHSGVDSHLAIQIDAAINPGNSGGALVNASGAVIGITSSIASLSSLGGGQSGSIGLGFAIPVSEAKDVADQLIASGKAQHALVGVTLTDDTVTVDGAQRQAAIVGKVQSGTPAVKAGLRSGDAIIGIDGVSVNGSDSLVAHIRARRPGTQVDLTTIRNGRSIHIKLTLAAKPG